MNRYTNLEKSPNGLRISLTDAGREYVREWREEGKNCCSESLLCDLLEYHTCNGWTWLRPEQIGDLTDAPILSDDVSFDETGEHVTALGDVYWHEKYQVECPVERMEAKGYVWFPKGGK